LFFGAFAFAMSAAFSAAFAFASAASFAHLNAAGSWQVLLCQKHLQSLFSKKR
jgi:hypothetical protein